MFAQSVQEFFAANLGKKMQQVEKMKRELQFVQRVNKLKAQKMEIQKAKVDQRQLSKVLVDAFSQSVQTVMQEK